MTTPTNDDGVVAGNAKVTLPALHMQDVSSLLTPKKLGGTNYVEWALNVKIKFRVGNVGDLFQVQKLHLMTPTLKNMKHGKMKLLDQILVT
jgi:hypothetical protein